jgi:hypothetical protein
MEKIKAEKGKDNLMALALSILKLEETLIEKASDTNAVITSVKEMLDQSFLYTRDNKIEINNTVQDLDLDYWKNNIHIFKTKNPDMNKDVYLYSIRNSLKFLLEIKKDKALQKAYIFEIIIKTFLFIDFLNFSIEAIIAGT